jgi:hypothetical protein
LRRKRAKLLECLKELNLMRKVIAWCALLILSLLLGSLYVQFLVTHPLRMSTYLALSYLALFAVVVILARYFRGGQRLVAAVLSVAVFAAGWYVMTGVVLDREDYRPIPELTRAKGDPGKANPPSTIPSAGSTR